MALPKNEDTTASQEGYILSERVTAISFTAGADYSQGDFHTVGNFFGIVAEDVANGSIGSLLVEPGNEIQAEQSGVTFALGDKVYYTSGGAFSKTYAATSKCVGVCTIASASDIFSFVNFGYLQDRVDDDDTYEIVATGEHTMATADEDIAIAGVLATDIVIVSYLSFDTTGAGTLTGAAEVDNVNIQTTEATTGNGVASYLVLRAN